MKIRKGRDVFDEDGYRHVRCVWCGKVQRRLPTTTHDWLFGPGDGMRWRNGHRVPHYIWSCSGECLDALRASQSELTAFDAARMRSHFWNAMQSCRHPAIKAIGGDMATQATLNWLRMMYDALQNKEAENRRRRESRQTPTA